MSDSAQLLPSPSGRTAAADGGAAPGPRSERLGAAGSGRPLRLLLAAYHDREAAAILMALRAGGFDVRHQRASSAAAVREALAAGAFDVTVGEFRTPAWSGPELLDIAIGAGSPCFLVCGAIGEDAAVTAIRAGASDVVSRMHLHRLAPSIAQSLDQRTAPLGGTAAAPDVPAPHPARGIEGASPLPDRSTTVFEAAVRLRPVVRQWESEQVARMMFDHSPVAMLLSVPGGPITDANDKFVGLSGYARAELIGRPVSHFRFITDTAQRQHLIDALEANRAVDGLDLDLRDRHGATRHILASISTLSIGGQAQRLHAFVDLTALHRATEAARLAHKAIASITQGVVISDGMCITLSVNDAFESMTGYTRSELVGRSCAMLQGPDTDPVAAQALREALDAGTAFNGDILNYRKDGTRFWNALSISPVRDDEGRLTHFVGIQRNVTHKRSHDSQLKLAARVFAQSREGVVITDARNEIVMVNQAFSAISGFAAADVLGRNPRDFAGKAQDESAYHAKWKTIADEGVWQGETVGRRRDGSVYPEWLTVSALRDDSGRICNYVRTFSDLSAQQAANERIDWLSRYDPLTALPNRSMLAERCRHDMAVAAREQGSVAMMVLGIDHFKSVNELLGNGVGDQLLREVGTRLGDALREQDTLARVGGDEFAMVLPGDSPDSASELAQRLLAAIARPFEIDDTLVNVTASIGVSLFPTDGDSFEAMFSSAQVAMHQVKERGRGNYRFFSAELFRTTVEQAAMIGALRHAVQQGQLRLHYQPFVDLRSGRISGMEALLRWTHPELGAVSPCQFIPLAERSGLIVDIGGWVLRQACRDLQQWRSLGLTVPMVSVNLSPAQFRDPELLCRIDAALSEFGADARSICLELTEGAVMDDVAHSEKLMRAIKQRGLQLSLDDFGTGYSSLSYLKLFPFDKVKIDQSFVRDITSNTQDAVIAKVVISMAHGLGLRVVAEGVETEAQCEFMRANLCDEMQGYFFSRPVPADGMRALLREDRCLPAHLLRVPHATDLPACRQQDLQGWHDALRSVPLPVIALDAGGMIVFANDRAQALCGNAGMLVSRSITQVLPALGAAIGDAPGGGRGLVIAGHTACEASWNAVDTRAPSGRRIVTLSPSSPLPP